MTQFRLLYIFSMIFLFSSCLDDIKPKPLSTNDKSESQRQTATDGQDSEDFDEVVSNYENEDREYWQRPDEVIRSLGDLSDKVVADIGAGTGYFTLRILPKAKKVIAIDIDPRMTKFIEELKTQLDEEFSEKLEIRLADADDPKLNMTEVDIIFLSNTYAYIENRPAYLKSLTTKLKPGGKVVIVDFKKKQIPVHPDQADRVALFEVERELIQAGYDIDKSDDRTLLYQYILEASFDFEKLK